MIEIVITAILSLVIGAGGMYFYKDDNPDKIDQSKISEKTKYESSRSSQYANCLDALRTGKDVGQNIRDCQPLQNDITRSGKLNNLESCIKLKRNYKELKDFDCKEFIK